MIGSSRLQFMIAFLHGRKALDFTLKSTDRLSILRYWPSSGDGKFRITIPRMAFSIGMNLNSLALIALCASRNSLVFDSMSSVKTLRYS